MKGSSNYIWNKNKKWFRHFSTQFSQAAFAIPASHIHSNDIGQFQGHVPRVRQWQHQQTGDEGKELGPESFPFRRRGESDAHAFHRVDVRGLAVVSSQVICRLHSHEYLLRCFPLVTFVFFKPSNGEDEGVGVVGVGVYLGVSPPRREHNILSRFSFFEFPVVVSENRKKVKKRKEKKRKKKRKEKERKEKGTTSHGAYRLAFSLPTDY